MPISDNSKVTFHFSLTLENGDIVDSTFDKAPATFAMGDGTLFGGFESRLLGMEEGQKASFEIPQEDGFGAHNPNNIQRFKRKDFNDEVELAEGLIMSFADAAGNELPGVVSSFDDATVVVDFNHPLAGKAITFAVEIVNVD
ncbi:FKBP-type 16 kDa peptidyl-prolyl cis-trans isomerase [BD1-7 clade bacterium]|uniref:Peptidyl-prolyl cis-trans isomerase n=1 Tax=BD1-7 clade bacterium TaxID=2029982 RepID=A0A5S9PV77_9GAMM|nr:FKBP-type 16 kDa peptidyl-prolyl cis-trans isomerase [BD1-7 clade bacterium]CAA0108793.1 FKBP-type 16 kDa peptidyl-prolyl cis-trans isomerase [BD1-7 clade bacterium]